jgi:hypothetical protein
MEFCRGADGAVHELVFHQPNGTFIARRDESDPIPAGAGHR